MFKVDVYSNISKNLTVDIFLKVSVFPPAFDSISLEATGIL